MRSIFDKIPELDSNELRKFGLLLAGFLALIFGLVFSIILGDILVWPWVLSAGLVVWSLLHANSLNFIYKAWMIMGALIGYLISTITLFLIFFFLVTPIGLIMRLRKKVQPQPNWIDCSDQHDSDYEKPY